MRGLSWNMRGELVLCIMSSCSLLFDYRDTRRRVVPFGRRDDPTSLCLFPRPLFPRSPHGSTSKQLRWEDTARSPAFVRDRPEFARGFMQCACISPAPALCARFIPLAPPLRRPHETERPAETPQLSRRSRLTLTPTTATWS